MKYKKQFKKRLIIVYIMTTEIKICKTCKLPESIDVNILKGKNECNKCRNTRTNAKLTENGYFIEYNQKNKQMISAKMKEYYDKKKEIISEQKKTYYEKNKISMRNKNQLLQQLQQQNKELLEQLHNIKITL